MKKTICLLLVLLMILTAFTGCREETPQSSSNATQTSEGENMEQRVINGVYASCGNYKYTIRATANASITFYLVTEKPLPKDAAITVDTESSYWFKITDRTPKLLLGDYPHELAKWVEYGVDFAKYYDAMEAHQLAWNDYANKQITKEEYIAAENARDQVFKEINLPDFEESWEKYINVAPPCYIYEVDLRVKHTGTEVVKECQLVAGDMSRTIQIGEVTQLYEKAPGFILGNNIVGTGVKLYDPLKVSKVIPNLSELKKSFATNLSESKYPWNPYDFLWNEIYFTAQNDITLTDVQSLDGYFGIKSAEAVIIGNNGEVALQWAPGTELSIRKGETVVLRVYIDHPDFHGLECSVRDELQVFYNDANGGGYMRDIFSFTRRRPLMEMYLWAFKEIDTKAFCLRFHENQKFLKENPLPALGG